MKRLFVIFCLLVFVFFASACNEDITTFSVATSSDPTTLTLPQTTDEPFVSVTHEEITLPAGASLSLLYESNVDVIFVSSNEAVASVRLDGLLEAANPGTSTISLIYNEIAYAQIFVTVVSDYDIVPPTKTIYRQFEPLNPFGCKLIFYEDEAVAIQVAVTSEMISGYDAEITGIQQLTITYLGNEYFLQIYVLNTKQEASLFNDFIIISPQISQYELLEFALTKADIDEFLAQIGSVYDYEEISIKALIQTPSGALARVQGFWMQSFSEQLVMGALNPSRNLEGLVTELQDDYNLVLSYVADGPPGYRMRYLPQEPGTYEMIVEVIVDGAIIQTFAKSFVTLPGTSERQGYVQIDASNNRHFAFGTGETYLPVGQNVAWYTSLDRKYYDYRQWFGKMHESGMDYARVWLSAWGFSPFWDDVTNFDNRQANLQSLDKVLELADDYDIFLQICILHHGMFSKLVNPMWPGSFDNWYTNKYGANPYGDHLDTPGKFFTDSWAKQSFKNQLAYLVARYGYSDNIMAWELVNETDWIEDYSALIGLAWHNEMAAFLKDIDPNHLVTTSLRNDSFYSSVFNVFNLGSIDYVNVHRYGVENHLDYLPQYQRIALNLFNKPVLYSEIGLKSSGSQQLSSDPGNISLHQGLWGGLMGGGAGSGMNWWWDSWIHVSDAYPVFAGAAAYAKTLQLSGQSYQTLSEITALSISHSSVKVLGYLIDGRLYAYLYDQNFTYTNPQTALKPGVTLTLPRVGEGEYVLKCYDTETGLEISVEVISQALTGQLAIPIPAFTNDIAITLTPAEE